MDAKATLIERIFRCMGGKFPVMYLGKFPVMYLEIPIRPDRLRKENWSHIIAKFNRKTGRVERKTYLEGGFI